MAVWLLALTVAVLLVGALAVRATATPASPQPPTPSPTAPVPLPTVGTCAPNTPLPVCDLPTQTSTPSPGNTATPTPPPTTPCTGQDCIPQPTSQPPGTGQPSNNGGGSGSGGGSDCGVFDITACISDAINNIFQGLVNAALSPILDLIGHTALSTPTLSSLPGIGDLWNNSWGLVLAAYGFFVLIGGIIVMSHESVQTRYSIKEIGPRIPLAFIASALSLFFADKFIQLANALSLAVLGGGVDAPTLGSTLQDAVQGAQSGGLFVILVGLVLVVVGLGLLIVYVVRIVITLILIISGPLFLMCHALPHTDGIARWWWKALAATLAIQVAQALVLITAVRTFLGAGVHIFDSTLSALGTLVTAIALFFILFKIPFWILGTIKVGSGRSFLGGLARAYIAAKTFGMVASKTGVLGRAGGTGAGGSAAGTGSTGRGGRSSPADPPWPAPPRFAPTPELVSRRLRQAHDAERVRAARHSRLPSQAPLFLQPGPQQTTHDPAVMPAEPVPTMPKFSSSPTPPPSARMSQRTRRAAGARPVFQTPGGARRRGATPPPARPIRAANVPPQLRFQPPMTATPSAAPKPAPPAAPSPSMPVFRQAHPERRIGDAYRRTPSVPPIAFRPPAPPPQRGGDQT
jgi:hypothetical protein